MTSRPLLSATASGFVFCLAALGVPLVDSPAATEAPGSETCRWTYDLETQPRAATSWWNLDPPRDLVTPGATEGEDRHFQPFEGVPRWVPVLDESAIQEATAIPAGIHKHHNGPGDLWGSYQGHFWMPEPLVALHFQEQLETLGFAVDQATSTPLPAHHLVGNRKGEWHVLLGRIPATCREVRIEILGYPEVPVTSFPNPPGDGLYTEVRLFYRERYPLSTGTP